MSRTTLAVAVVAAICLPPSSPSVVAAKEIEASFSVNTPMGHFLKLDMKIDDVKTRFELTGPDFSYFAFGFDATTMMGYSLIVEGVDASRTIVEQNLVGIGNPGGPQAVQNISVVDVIHDAPGDLTTAILERPNDTGDPLDPDFSTSLSSLNVIWAYYPFASPDFPQPDLAYHGSSGRGFATITFTPEPATPALAAVAIPAFVRLARRSSAKRCCGQTRGLLLAAQ
jgi:hypothetical protein